MGDFIIQYWLEFVFGLITAGLGFFCRRYWKLWKSEKDHQRTTEQKEFYDSLKKLIEDSYKKSSADDEVLQNQIDNISEDVSNLKIGLLSIQGKQFKNECRRLLEQDHEISTEEYENILQDHSAYKMLGGNHDGDSLFKLVEQKASNCITK